MAAKDTEEQQKPEEQDSETMLDMSQAQVKKMIADARERGYITYDQLNQVMPPEQVSSEQIEDVMSMLSEMGINIIEDDEAEELWARARQSALENLKRKRAALIVLYFSCSAGPTSWSLPIPSCSTLTRSWSRTGTISQGA